MYDLDKKIAESLLQIKAIKLNPANHFTWASGWYSPIYCDNRKVLSYPAVRKEICNGFVKIISEKYPDVDIIAGVAITSAGFIACECFPQAITSMFTNNAELSAFAETGLRACVMMYPLVGCQMVITQFFQSIGKAKVSIFLSLTRQLIYLLPCLLVLPAVWGVNGVWASMPLSDVFAFLTAVGMLLHYQRQWKKKQPAVR